MTWILRLFQRPIAWLLAVALAAGLFTYRDFGLTWDEPLFYAYADAVGYAYTPTNWFKSDFDLTRAYGPSGDDHKTRGPGYLLIARIPVAALRSIGWDAASAWHLVNFSAFLLGVYFTYRLCRMLTGELAALLGAAAFASQPLLWGHAFINPKDMPFLVFFTGTVWLGMRGVDRLVEDGGSNRGPRLAHWVLPAIFLGLASSNRVLGPLAGALVSLYWIARQPAWRTLFWIAIYGSLALAVMFATWPYLWGNPLRFFEVYGLMAENPTVLPVLFADTVYRANELPLRYLPFYLAATLTEPTWPLFALGIVAGIVGTRRTAEHRLRVAILLVWILIPFCYVLIASPPMYDGMRHFLFILPPAFVIGAAGIDFVFQRLSHFGTRSALAALILLPGLAGMFVLHPYEYAYFNSIVGGTRGAFRRYETDYWLTCYKESVERFNTIVTRPARLFVHREAVVAAPYAAPHVTVLEERGSRQDIQAGDFVLVNTRTNEDQRVFRDSPELLAVGRGGATFCVIKRVE